MSYFAVYIPEPEFPRTDDSNSSGNTNVNHQSLIFMEKSQALDVLRRHKEARLREFPSREQAQNYIQFGFESRKEQEKQQEHQQELPPVTSERSFFHSPTKQELQEFRKQIEAGNLELVRRIVWENPRYLISSGDTPTSLKEGPRYNAMHICAQLNQPSIAEFLLETIADPAFGELYADKKGGPEMYIDLSKNLLDLYLNMPDKSRGETPLHFAAKNGHVDVVEVLIGYLQCKSLLNREGKEPRDIICQRNEQVSRETLKKLELLLGEPYYVPVLRSETNEVPPEVGQPYSPKEPPNLLKKESTRLRVKLTISALAGPMSRDQALKFHRRWKTPPRLGSNSMSPLATLPFTLPVKMMHSRSSSMQMSPRKLFSLDSEELPSTLNTEDYLLQDLTQELSMYTLNDNFRERHIKNSNIGKGLEVVGRQLAREEQLEWREYWEFLDAFVDISSSKGLAQLESYLKSKMAQLEGSVSEALDHKLKSTEALAQDQDELLNLEDTEDNDSFYDLSLSDSSSISSSGRSSFSEDSFKSIPEPTVFIKGESPMKWDLDILNAIYHVEIDEKTWPYVHAWKTALEQYSPKDMERFPSPQRIGKTRKPGCWYSTTFQEELNSYQTSIHPKGLFGS
ncbi:ankyrin repeat and LEM domain-containing protein 2 homolog isoform X1 [Drosophila kikkawai]|uniref:Ankyrin repeat and LEM domain-containing protein 2 homolog isoform X1 n=1 Tax=Drosophila kikkawai TaxID=30033 RepID=A0ABM3C6I2_DROKI|nr:ankyrin repeat and LEM domain-containing protein 2 homolog [Drosophila kikkawai]